MDYIDDGFIFDLSASCSKDQAVMRLLGWGLITIYPKNLHLLPDGSISEDSKIVYQPNFSLYEFLSDLYRRASEAYLNAVPDGASDEEAQLLLEKMAPKLIEAEDMIERARDIKLDIVDELARGDASELRIDREATLKHNEQYITIRSLDRWSKVKYASISAQSDGVISEEALDSKIGQLNKPIAAMSKPESGLYTVLGLVTEAYAKELGVTYFSSFGEVNIKKVSEAVVGWSCTHMPTGQSFPDQSFATVKARLTTAQRCLSQAKPVKASK